MNQFRVLILCDGDPDADRLFSGAAKYLTSALAERGVVHAKGNVASSRGFWDRNGILARIGRRAGFSGVEARSRWSRRSFATKTAGARAIAATHPAFDTCLMFGTTYLPNLGVPTYCYLDATVQQVRDADAWEFRYFDESFARSIQDYQQSVFNQCACVFTFSEWAADSVVRDYGIDLGRVLAVGGGSNFSRRPEAHGPYDRQRILFVGKDFERKGGPLIVEAFRRVRREMPDATLVIAGCDPGLREPGIEVEGYIAKDGDAGEARLLRLYRDASVLCLMSTFEPFGLVVVEAQHCGVPCVVPDRFAFRETVQDGVTGRRVGSYEPEELAAVLARLLRDPARLEKMGQVAQTTVREHFAWDIVANRVIERMTADRAAPDRT